MFPELTFASITHEREYCQAVAESYRDTRFRWFMGRLYETVRDLMLAGFCLLICVGCDRPADQIPRGGKMMPTPVQQEMIDRMDRIEKRIDALETDNARKLLDPE